jgi:hypothetical protein
LRDADLLFQPLPPEVPARDERPRKCATRSAPGNRDLILAFPGVDRVVANLANFVPQLRGKVMLRGCGHWIQQERASEVNSAMID